jgi:hypothetical protein
MDPTAPSPGGDDEVERSVATMRGHLMRCHELKGNLDAELGCLQDAMREADAWIARRIERLKEDTDRTSALMKRVHEFQSTAVKLNVGGVHYDTSLVTLQQEPNSMLAAMFSGRFPLEKDEDGRYFIDRDGKHFDIILNFLRDGTVERITDESIRDKVLREARYYALESLVLHLTAPPTHALNGAPIGTAFRWDHLSPNVTADESLLALSTNSATWVHGWSAFTISTGVHYWEVELQVYDTRNTLNIAIGVTKAPLKVSCVMGYSYNPDAWGYVAGTGKLTHNKSYSMEYGEPAKKDDVIGVKVDMFRHTLEFFKNGVSMGVAFSNITGPVQPAVSLVHKQQVALLQPPRFPPRA